MMRHLSVTIFICGVIAVFSFTQNTTANEPRPQSDGTITGKVTFSGAVPKNTPWKITKNMKVCGHVKTLDRLLVDKSGGVANTFIILKGVSGSTAGMGNNFSIDQIECHYKPHVQVVPLNGTLTVTNSDDVLHNIHGYYFADHSTAFNIAQPIQNQHTPIPLKQPGFIELQCDAGHTWMSAYIYVADNPYAVVTNTDGSFTISNVPPGTYTLQCWHEGWNITGEQNDRPIFSKPQIIEQSVTVTDGGTAQVQFQLHN
ncbi:MAG TPA: carboxypeptidase regulatory-like domain-containing protein [Candidatus Kapabacteria bacterium]|nr:carboxypeptidase regulatory-like domain-containing protein [Candidatus Kapabacteria bacterium]